MKHSTNYTTKVLALVLTIAALAVGQSSAFAAENGWEISSSTSGTVTTFTISRTNTAVAETVKYRFVNLSAYAGQHYNVTKVNGANSSALTGEFTFAAGETGSRTIQVTESAGSGAYSYYKDNTQRSYKLELTDAGGFYLTKNQRSFTTGTSVNSSNVYAEQSVTVASGPVTITHDGFDQGYHAVSMSTYFSNAAPQAYLVAAGAELRMVVTLDEAEKDDGYQHIQLLVNKTTSFDDNASEGNPGTPTNSHYLASFAHKPGSTLTTYASVCFPLTSATDNCSAVDPAWNFSPYNNTVGKLYTQKFKSGYRASDGKLIVAKKSELNGLSTVGIRFDASGDNADTWYAKNVTAKFTAVDETAPTVLAVSVAPGYHAKGNTVYVSVAFSEIVTTSSAKLTSSWGDLAYVAGSGTNVLTFSRTIPASASGALSITGFSGITDLGGKAPSSVSSNNLCSLDANYVYTISYDLDGGSVATENPATYHYETAAFTLNNPIKPGYSFDGWTGSNGNTPQKTVSIANHSHGNRTYTANWVPLWGQDDNADGSQAHPYIISSIDGLNMLAKVTNGTDGFTATSSDGVFYRLDSNLDLGGNGFDGIGFSDVYYFNGTFDGNGKTISNFVINKPGVSKVGIFGNCMGGVKNLIVDNAVVKGYRWVGIIVGTSYSGTFTNCLVFNSSITCDKDGGVIYGNLSSNMKVSGCHYANCTVNDTPASDMYRLTLGNGITASGETVVHDTDTYGVAGTTVTLSYSGQVPEGYHPVVYTVNGTPIEGNSFTMPAEDVSVSASVTPITYNITFDLGGGSVATANPTSYNVESAAITLVNPTREGYTFAGWTGTGLDAATETVTIPAGSVGERSYTATWTLNTYTITCDLGGGSVATANPASYNVESAAITLVNPTRTGYTFAGWTGTGLNEPTMEVIIPTGSIGERSYTATWKATTYSVHFDANGGKGTMDDQSFTYDQEQQLSANAFTCEGNVFVGWNTAADGTGTWYTPLNYYTNLPTHQGDVVILYAQWMVGREVSYIDADGTEKHENAILITSSQTDYGFSGNGTTREVTHWYVVSGEVNLSWLHIEDDYVHLILEDGARLTINSNNVIAVRARNLTIYGQSNGTGQIIASSENNWGIATGGYSITINGGNITATSGSNDGIYSNGKPITINGGNVTATSESSDGISGSKITINGGNVTATGGHIGINGGKITINGGNVTATGDSFGIYIPHVPNNNDYLITLAGGTVWANSYNGIVRTNNCWYTNGTNIIQGSNLSKDAIAGKTMQPALRLNDKDNFKNNITTIAEHNGETIAAVQLFGRTLYKDGDWNTLCLPFSLTAEQMAASPLAGAEARTLSSASYANGTLTLNFSDPVESLTAGTPYIIKWAKAIDYVDDNEHNIKNPIFTNVTIDNTAHNVETTNVSFVGTYGYRAFSEENKSILLVGAGNSLYYPLSGASLGSCRAYFQLNGITAGDLPANGVKMFFGEEDDATSLSGELRVKSVASDDAVYDLSGRKVNSQLKKGLYIKNGKKMLINK